MPPVISLRPAIRAEADLLSALCLRSKAVWGYDDPFLRACRDELAILPEALSPDAVQVAEIGGEIAGVVQISVDGATASLDKLFVEPRHIGSGVGRRLYDWAKSQARSAGAVVMTIDGDPGAAPFYRRMGALEDGVVRSGSIPGRVLPRFRADLVGGGGA